jgi:hypothetical protein
MKLEKISEWFWDIAKYVISAIIITSFLGGFEEPAMLYIMSGLLVTGLILCGILFYVLSNKEKK